ncbi:hypothetical protein AYI70_g9262 [Smittium culicis]|uniref:Uncharacterized protein n=1 Tax=Smittium culicis TaxID=133412 RepID=A0A1R1XC46_9FUNG|nr:hypothetical protein AYI70_g9262 [Smittium culicis]
MESQAHNVTAPSYASAPVPTADSMDMSDNETNRDLYIVDRAPPRDLLAYPELLIPYQVSKTISLGLHSQMLQEENLLDCVQKMRAWSMNPRTTRPIEYYVQTILQREPNSLSAESAIEFAKAMRILLSDLSSHVTLLRMENAFRNAKIPGKAPQILSASSNPLLDPKELVEHVASNKKIQKAIVPTRSANKRDYSIRRCVFQKNFSDRNYNNNKQQKCQTQARYMVRTNSGRKEVPFLETRIMGLLLATLLVTRGGMESPGRGTAESLPKSVGETHKQSSGHICDREGVQDSTIDPTKNTFASKAIQNGESVGCIKACSSQRLDGKHRSCRRIPSPSSTQMGKTACDKDNCLLGRFVDLRIEQGRIAEEHTEGDKTPTEARIYNQGKGILIGSLTTPNTSGNENQYTIDDVRNTKRQGQGPEEGCKPPHNQGYYNSKKISIIHRKGSGHIHYTNPWSFDDQKDDRAKERSSEKKLNLELVIWKSRSFLPEVPEVEFFTDASDSGWGKGTANKYKGVDSNPKRLIAPRNNLKECDCLFRQQKSIIYVKKQGGTQPPALLKVSEQLHSFKDEYKYGMVNTRQDNQQDRYEVRTARCGYVCSPGEPKTVEICQLETITRSSSNGRFQSPVEFLEESILLPTLGSHHENNPKGKPREINFDANKYLVDNGDLVPRSNKNVDSEINQNTSRRSAPGTYKRKFDNVEDQGFVA